VFGAFSAALCGMLGLHRGQHLKAAHKVNLWGLFVRPSWRGQGAGQQLLAAALAHARTFEGARSIHVSVSGAAPGARRLYERAGFSLWGSEPEAIQFAGQFTSEHHLRLALAPPS
jgi:RimJ/RimL family protein N-acetyltransferase